MFCCRLSVQLFFFHFSDPSSKSRITDSGIANQNTFFHTIPFVFPGIKANTSGTNFFPTLPLIDYYILLLFFVSSFSSVYSFLCTSSMAHFKHAALQQFQIFGSRLQKNFLLLFVFSSHSISGKRFLGNSKTSHQLNKWYTHLISEGFFLCQIYRTFFHRPRVGRNRYVRTAPRT